ncbi:MAG: aminotransferase [Pseudonocardiales bacterium]|nr:aminotransferase class I/II-fold pyridoxal phosphate-dependent enzyme [Pseudonocardiales bacterium]PZS27291.1 MAG: aminotransferase [Pseudonocardiales bacterium]
MKLTQLPTSDLARHLDGLRREYGELQARVLTLDLTRGKPSAEQLDLSEPLLELPGAGKHLASDGTDTRNYGGLRGLAELREIFSEVLGVPVEQLIAFGNSSLELMHECLVHAVLFGVPGSAQPWGMGTGTALLCPVPGYDRHFALCEKLRIEMITVPMDAAGPDMDDVERLVAADARIKGIWCVPKYSNPSGIRYSEQTVGRLAQMRTVAADFRIFWDNAYAVHHLTGVRHEVADILQLASDAGHADRPLVFGSTSKITLAGSGVAFYGASVANVDWLTGHLAKRTIGPDKINQLRHALFLETTAGVHAHMNRHRALLKPKFDLVQRTLGDALGDSGVATWTVPEGGYFVTLDVLDGCASRVVELAAGAGIALTAAGAPFPYGRDPHDRVIRLAPTYPPLSELAEALDGLVLCIKLAAIERLLDTPVTV